MADNNVGRVSQVLGAVVDVSFDGELPSILNALTATFNGQELVLESFEAGNVGVLTERFVGHGEEVSEAL